MVFLPRNIHVKCKWFGPEGYYLSSNTSILIGSKHSKKNIMNNNIFREIKTIMLHFVGNSKWPTISKSINWPTHYSWELFKVFSCS